MNIEILPQKRRASLIAQDVTAVIVTFNEVPNIARVLDRLAWVKRIIILDSFSTDETLIIASRYKNVEIIQRAFDSFAQQCNFGLSNVDSEWVLSLDADYVLTPELETEIQALRDDPAINGYSVPFKYCVDGRPLRRTLLPNRTILYRTQKGRYNDEGHGHRVSVIGNVGKLRGFLNHDDRKSLLRWLQNQIKYMEIETPYLLARTDEELTFPDKIRKRIFFAAPLILVHSLFVKRLFLDGWRGCYYVLQRVLAESLLSLFLLDARLTEANKQTAAPPKSEEPFLGSDEVVRRVRRERRSLMRAA